MPTLWKGQPPFILIFRPFLGLADSGFSNNFATSNL